MTDEPGCSCACWAPGWACLLRTWRSCRAPSHFCAACPPSWRQSGGRCSRRSTLSGTCDLPYTAEAPAPWSRPKREKDIRSTGQLELWNTWVMMTGIKIQIYICDKNLLTTFYKCFMINNGLRLRLFLGLKQHYYTFLTLLVVNWVLLLEVVNKFVVFPPFVVTLLPY